MVEVGLGVGAGLGLWLGQGGCLALRGLLGLWLGLLGRRLLCLLLRLQRLRNQRLGRRIL